jgi:ArsR family transcriptional regulator
MEAFLSVFKALSNDTRWRILELLKQGPLCVNAIVCHLEVSQPAVSQHLKTLEHAGLVQGEKIGLRVHYALVPERLQECAAVIGGLTPTQKGGR